MRVMLTQRNQITIPRNYISELGLELGKYYELNICEGKIELDISNSFDEPAEEKIKPDTNNGDSKDKEKDKDKKLGNLFTVQVVSNLEEGAHFSNKVYSDCGLVIRTKRAYLTKLCDACQGKLVKEHGLENHKCPYLKDIEEPKKEIIEEPKPIVTPKVEPIIETKRHEAKQIISKIIDNTTKLNSQIDNRINNLSSTISKPKPDLQKLKQLKKLGDRIIKPVKYPAYKVCTGCDELYENGFLIADTFYCKECAKADFYNYLDKRKECEP